MGWTHQEDEIAVSTRTKTGSVRAEWTGTYVDIFFRENHLDAFQPKMVVETQEQLRRLMQAWLKVNDPVKLLNAQPSRSVIR